MRLGRIFSACYCFLLVVPKILYLVFVGLLDHVHMRVRVLLRELAVVCRHRFRFNFLPVFLRGDLHLLTTIRAGLSGLEDEIAAAT